jgi:hypothetical protein
MARSGARIERVAIKSLLILETGGAMLVPRLFSTDRIYEKSLATAIVTRWATAV